MQYKSYTQDFVTYKNGADGNDGADGKSQYLHVKYSDDGENFTANDGNDLGAWIGTLVDFNEEASLTFSDYTWKKFTEDVDDELQELYQRVQQTEADIQVNSDNIKLKASQEELEKVSRVANETAGNVSSLTERMSGAETSIGLNTQEIALKASKEEVAKKVDSDSFESYQSKVESQFTQTAESIDMKFSAASEQTKEVDGDLQEWKNQYNKHIVFSSETAITITSGGTNKITLVLDNEEGIVFKKNDVAFGWWDGENFHTGNIEIAVNERAQFGKFAFVPRSDNSLMFLKVGG